MEAQEKKEKYEKNSLGTWAGDIKAEFKKVMWMDKKSVAKQTLTVILTSLFVGAIIVGMDQILSALLRIFTAFVG